MYEQETVATNETAKRAEWKCPEIRRLEAGRAELGSNPGGDAINSVS